MRAPRMASNATLNYLDEAIAGFERDPAGTDFQRGFLDALRVVRREAALPQLERLADIFGSIKELADSDETLMVWRTADEELQGIYKALAEQSA